MSEVPLELRVAGHAKFEEFKEKVDRALRTLYKAADVLGDGELGASGEILRLAASQLDEAQKLKQEIEASV